MSEFKPQKTKSIARTAKGAITADTKARSKKSPTVDSFVNFAQNLGVGADNALSTSSYGFNPITRNRTQLEWIHRGSWLAGAVVDSFADDMTRAGIDHCGSIDPDDMLKIDETATTLGIWNVINDTEKWARLYGGAIAVILIDGQDPETPLRLNTIRQDQFKGLLSLDRWMVEPSLSDLVTDYGPSLGLPKFYRVTAQAPALSNVKIHHSRCLRLDGIRLPYWQRLMENLWGLSIIERLYDRMIAFDSATTGAAQLVYKSYLRTLKVKDMRELVAAGGDALNGLTRYVDMMRRFQGIEGMTVIDADDDFTVDGHSAFGGLSDALQQFGQQLSGASGIPLVRLFGQSPAGFSTGETDLRNYYDTIKQKQIKDLLVPVTKIYRCIAASEGIKLPDGYKIEFKSLWQMSDSDKADIAAKDAETISKAEEGGLIDRAVALKELRQSSQTTGRFTNITDEMITEAENEPPPIPEDAETPNPENMEQTATKTGDGMNIAAGVIVQLTDGRILIMRREKDGDWDLPGGGNEKGETPEETAIRECEEECGHTPDDLKKVDHTTAWGTDFTTYLSKNNQEFKPELDAEHTAYKWLSIEEALDMNLHKGLRNTLKTLHKA